MQPELISEKDLLDFLVLSQAELKKIWWHRDRMYSTFVLPSKSGKTRNISAPETRLKYLQRGIADLLTPLYPVKNYVHGFVSNKSVKSNALAHLRKKYVLNLDIADFFPSISERRITGMLSAIGVEMRVAQIISRVCCYRGCLPQGAPSSPILSNMILFRLDRELFHIAKRSRCIYTRYADDLTFSSSNSLRALFSEAVPPSGNFEAEQLNRELNKSFLANGFALNQEKCHYADKYSRRMVTGLKINEIVNVDRSFIRNIRATLHCLECSGIKDAQALFESKYAGRCNLREHLEGKISWLRHIRGQSDPVFRSIAIRFNKIFPESAIEVKPTLSEMIDRSVWVVEHDTIQGSAFFLDGVGLVTAAHNVEGGVEIEIYHPSKTANKFKVEISCIDVHRDVAVLKHNLHSSEYFELTRSNILASVGNQTHAIGYPGYGPGDRLNIRTGTISSTPRKRAVLMVEVTQSLAQGMSGGPLVDSSNSVIGVIHKGGPAEARDFAVHINELYASLK